jgi:Fis family transcriptional regulator, factor for inversion stimulation protein
MKSEFDGTVDRLLGAGIFLPEAVEILERGMIAGALKIAAGNQCAAAKALGIHRNTLQRKMAGFGLGRPPRKSAGRVGAPRRRRSA